MTKPKVERDEHGRILPGSVCNPTGKGGFQERPQDRGGSWDKTLSRTYLLNKFQRMTQDELLEYMAARGKRLTIVEQSCIQTVLETIKRGNQSFKWIQEVSDRTEGRPRMQIDTTVATTEPPQINITFG